LLLVSLSLASSAVDSGLGVGEWSSIRLILEDINCSGIGTTGGTGDLLSARLVPDDTSCFGADVTLGTRMRVCDAVYLN
jgi:hypothetical protein